MTTIFLVEGCHPIVPGRPQVACATIEVANREAAALLATIIPEYPGIEGPVTAWNWREIQAAVDEAVKETNDDGDNEEAYVTLNELEIIS